jgi:hypothetical protein
MDESMRPARQADDAPGTEHQTLVYPSLGIRPPASDVAWQLRHKGLWASAALLYSPGPDSSARRQGQIEPQSVGAT